MAGDATTEGGRPLKAFILPGLFVVVLFATLWARRPDSPKPVPQWEFSGQAFGTSYSVKVIPSGKEGDRDAITKAIKEEVDKVNDCMSTWLPNSELSKLNKNGASGTSSISPMLTEVLVESAKVHKLSGGAFDITIGPLVKAWGFRGDKVKAPTPEALKQARAQVGAADLEIDAAKNSLKRARSGLVIDVSAVGKGYGVDRLGLVLEGLGYRRYLVEIGGEVRARGLNRFGKPWSIGVEKPDGGAQDVAELVSLPDMSIATSGNYRNFLTLEGKTVTHIIDARSGQPVSHGLGSVSVLAPSCMRADALATALYVLGEDDGFALAEREKIAALFLTPGSKGKAPKRRATSAYTKLLKGAKKPQ